ncbi:hypothetical protein OAO18_07990, partial [Francisellaceae bacterium]|nr:hypothetical protein [Francisellaceae bacterium]
MKKLITTTLATICLSSIITISNAAVTQPSGWPDYLSMGTVSNFTDTVTNAFNDGKKVDFIFAYGAYMAGGTTADLPADPSDWNNPDDYKPVAPTSQTSTGSVNALINQAQQISQSSKSLTQPVITLYSLNLSAGVHINGDNSPQGQYSGYYNWDQQNIIEYGLENIILNAQALTAAKPDNQDKYGVIILNPDFLGQVHTDNEQSTQFKNVDINKAVSDALSAEGVKTQDIPTFSNDVKGFVEANNYILSTYYTSVNYGWVVNTWAGGNANFVHGSSSDVTTNVNTVDALLDDTGVYSGQYQPGFIVFDKYEANDYSALTSVQTQQGTSNVIDLGYLFNARDMHNYLSYIGGVSSHINKPAMLWQIPGGHLIQSTDDKANPVTIGTEPDYIFGSGLSEYTPSSDVTNPAQAIPFLSSLNLDTTMPSSYNFNGGIGSYLTMDQNGNTGKYDWTEANTQELVNDNIVAVLWGGGSTTGIVDNIAQDRAADPNHPD